jgi:hypothetical protein
MEKRISREESLEAPFKGGQGSISSIRAKGGGEFMTDSFHTYFKS